MQSVSETENIIVEDFEKSFEKEWDFYISNEKMDLKEYHIGVFTQIQKNL